MGHIAPAGVYNFEDLRTQKGVSVAVSGGVNHKLGPARM